MTNLMCNILQTLKRNEVLCEKQFYIDNNQYQSFSFVFSNMWERHDTSPYTMNFFCIFHIDENELIKRGVSIDLNHYQTELYQDSRPPKVTAYL